MSNEKELSIDLKPEVTGGNYSNLAIITHSRSEFIFDFARILPGLNKPEVFSRIIMAPEHAKRLLMALSDNVKKYEASVCEISLDNMESPNFPINTPIKGGNIKS